MINVEKNINVIYIEIGNVFCKVRKESYYICFIFAGRNASYFPQSIHIVRYVL